MKVILIQLSYRRFMGEQGLELRTSTGEIGDLQLRGPNVCKGY